MVAKNLIAMGDSHLEALKYAAELGLLDVEKFAFSIVPGATAVGLRNPNSFTDAINTFRGSLKEQSRKSLVLVHLGEVDCGFVIWWRAKKFRESVLCQFLQSLRAYDAFLREMIDAGFRNICIVGASLPTISDGVDFGEVANKRSEVDVAIEFRTRLTIAYNKKLKSKAEGLGLSYFDITDAVLDRKTKLISEFFKNPDPSDHHLDKDKVVGIWVAEVNKLLKLFD